VDNTRALRCYEKSGFAPIEHTSDRLVFGRAEVSMAINRARWDELRQSNTAETDVDDP